MAQPDPAPNYVVLPTKVKKGETVLLFKTAIWREAQDEAIRQTAATGVQHEVFTSTHYVEPVETWSDAAVHDQVKPIVPVFIP